VTKLKRSESSRSDRGPIRARLCAAVPLCAAISPIWKARVATLQADDVPRRRLVLHAGALAPDMHPETMLMLARRLGLATSRLPSLDAGDEALRLAPVAVEDLFWLASRAWKIDYRRLEDFIKGKTVVVTWRWRLNRVRDCDRVVNSGARPLVDPGKFGNRPCMRFWKKLTPLVPSDEVEGRIADIRDRDRYFA